MTDTIFAPATAAGRAAVAILRLSGPGVAAALGDLSGVLLPKPRRASVRRLVSGEGETLDEALVLWMPGPRSFTGEDCAELHLHGGRAILTAVAARLSELGLRMAEPGEFTRRAFEHGRLDLSQAEAVADLVDAETAAQRRQALAQFDGALSLRYETWRDMLLDILALLEAGIDFPDEEVPTGVTDAARTRLIQIAAELRKASTDDRGERVRDGYRVALVGAPNVGKSSLLNALAGRDAAIVTELAGTTRDVIEVSLVLGGHLIVLADTAGLRDAGDLIEAEGVRRARAWAASAALRIGVVDQTRPETVAVALEGLASGDLVALNKSDLIAQAVRPPIPVSQEAVETSATVMGVSSLLARIVDRVTAAGEAGFPAVTRARHRTLLQEAANHLQRAIDDQNLGGELMAEDVRLALRSLERVTGRSNPEAVLDRVFSGFCIGK